MTKSINRRDAIKAMGAIGALTLTGAMSGCSEPENPMIVDPDTGAMMNSAFPSVLESNNLPSTLTASIANALLMDSKKNSCLSPTSLSIALTILAVGSKGKTQKELLDVLKAKDIDTLSESCAQMIAEVSLQAQPGDGENAPQVLFANSIWASKHYEITPTYSKRLSEDFGARISTCNFADSKVNDQISNWVSKKTHDLLKPKFSFDSSTVMALINAIYFRDCWQTPFDAELTEKAEFKTQSGTKQVSFMHLSTASLFAEFAECQIGELRFANTGATLRFMLPWEGGDAASLLRDSKTFDALLGANLEDCQVNWSVPKFSIKNTFDLNDALKTLGLNAMFEPSQDFDDAIHPKQKKKKSELCVSGVEQGATIEIDEEGALAAAYTAIGVKAMSLPHQPEKEVDFTLDRPFVYALFAWDGAPLFVGTVQKPKN